MMVMPTVMPACIEILELDAGNILEYLTVHKMEKSLIGYSSLGALRMFALPLSWENLISGKIFPETEIESC